MIDSALYETLVALKEKELTNKKNLEWSLFQNNVTEKLMSAAKAGKGSRTFHFEHKENVEKAASLFRSPYKIATSPSAGGTFTLTVYF